MLIIQISLSIPRSRQYHSFVGTKLLLKQIYSILFTYTNDIDGKSLFSLLDVTSHFLLIKHSNCCVSTKIQDEFYAILFAGNVGKFRNDHLT